MATTIDGTWLSGHGNSGAPPYVLNSLNEVYTLATDVRVTNFFGPVFQISNGAQLVKAGYKVYIDGWEVDQDLQSYHASSHEQRAVQANPIHNASGGKFLLGDKMSNINVDPSDKEKLNSNLPS